MLQVMREAEDAAAASATEPPGGKRGGLRGFVPTQRARGRTLCQVSAHGRGDPYMERCN